MQLREHESELATLGADVLVVTFERMPIARAYVEETGLPWPLVVDADLSLYTAYGMGKARWRDLINARALWLYLKLMLRGGPLHMPTGDTKQRGGNVIVDPAGIVRLHCVAEGPAGRPSIETLMDVVRQR